MDLLFVGLGLAFFALCYGVVSFFHLLHKGL